MKEKDILQVVIVILIASLLVNVFIPFVEGKEKPLIVLSGSMVPLFLPGDLVIEKSVDPNTLNVGDVLVFHPPRSKPGALVTHRIISLEDGEERLFQTKGDANNAKDDMKVPASNAIGKLIFVIPFVGYLPDFLRGNKNIFIFIVILPAGLLVLDEIKSMIIFSNPTRARKIEKERKTAARRTSYVIKGKRLATLILISGLVFTGIFACNLGENGSIILERENTVENQGFLSQVFVLTPDNIEQRLSINPWYGVISPENKTQVTTPENTPAKISSVPYILPVFWIIMLAEVNPYLPAAAEITIYTSVFILLLFPLWYRKSTIVGRRKRFKFHRLLAQWKRTFHFG